MKKKAVVFCPDHLCCNLKYSPRTTFSMIRVLVFSYHLFWLPLCHGLDCTIDSDCNLKYSTKSSVCGENGTCTNPFEKGCLRTMAQIHGATNMPPLGGDRKFKKEDEGQPFSIRVCNSDDTATIGSSSATDSCKKLEMESYKEIRIAPGNWDQCTFCTSSLFCYN